MTNILVAFRAGYQGQERLITLYRKKLREVDIMTIRFS